MDRKVSRRIPGSGLFFGAAVLKTVVVFELLLIQFYRAGSFGARGCEDDDGKDQHNYQARGFKHIRKYGIAAVEKSNNPFFLIIHGKTVL